LSDSATRRRTISAQTRQRRKGATRGGRHGLSRSTVAIAGDALAIDQPTAASGRARGRRPLLGTAARPLGISRETEYAYIRSDMRRLFVIAGALMALMLILLIFVNR